jgi:hypothetical protein
MLTSATRKSRVQAPAASLMQDQNAALIGITQSENLHVIPFQ